MNSWFKKNYKTVIILAFLIPIITVAIVSISHVTKWYGISNPLTWAIYLSIGIEIAALSALAAISANMGKKVYFPFGIVTLVQFIGNVYFAYSYIDIQSPAFISWVELFSPLLEIIGVESTDFVGHKRFLAFFAGGMLPIISLSFLHMLVKFVQEERENEINKPINEITPVVEEPVVEETPVVIEEPVIEEPIIVEEPVVVEPLVEEPVVEETPVVIEEPVIEELFVEEPVVEETPVTEEVLVTEEPIIVEEPVVVEPLVEEPVVEETPVVIEEPVIEELFVEEMPVIEETPVIEEPVIVTDGLMDAPPPVFEESIQITEELPVDDNEEEKKN
jgi:hypothetical protein